MDVAFNKVVASITLRAVFGRKRALLFAIPAAVLILFTIALKVSRPPARPWPSHVLGTFGFSVLLLDEPFNGMDPRQRLHMMDLLSKLGAEGRTILLSSHILEEVEQLAGTIQVIVSGRLAASGDFRAIRRLMTSRPHVFLVRTSDDRRLGAALIGRPAVTGVEVTGDGLQVRAADYGAFSRELAALTRDEGIRLRELLPEDESLESVFAYLVES